ncbi:hypothetical protein GCK72_025834 [Caenorhabditis remanei]|uniref:Uncharacterized protein n=1 Tax=Caenorhabditis remanei TaxID=31234 RepID=E3MEA5_CAERE|nr:hypothetical protein GCK72_025834 [Caenorhabditis remanei]EFO99572.1 hypothetical protein CRE_22357 [Caenorhabditis remanei]KAF1749366.1 hypothetical protein GCK72_025834 [Caenorhabditis remanei]
MSNPTTYAAIPGTVVTAQPTAHASETQPFARPAQDPPKRKCSCCQPCCFVAALCVCLVKFCGAICDCDDGDEFDD